MKLTFFSNRSMWGVVRVVAAIGLALSLFSAMPAQLATAQVLLVAPTISKAFSPSPISLGETSTITFTLGNTNTSNLTGAKFNDPLPTGMSVKSTGPAGGSCTGASSNNFTAGQTGTLVFTGLTISLSSSCTVTIDVTTDRAGSFLNGTTALLSNEKNGGRSNTVTLIVKPTITTLLSASAILVGIPRTTPPSCSGGPGQLPPVP